MMAIPTINVTRDKLNYEIRSITMNNQEIIITGWALMPKMQHFKNNNTHAYEIELKTDDKTINIPGSLSNIDMTKQMEYRGYPNCSQNTYEQTNCNYTFENVGFTFKVPLSELEADKDYELYLKMHAKQAKKIFRIPIFYVQDDDTIFTKDDLEYTLLSDFKYMRFSVFARTLIGRKGPSPLSDAIQLGPSCSLAYGNDGFLRYNAVFNNIFDVNIYNNLITYFKVQVTHSGCVDSRQRLIESRNSNQFIHVPSTHINYLGQPTVLYVRQNKTTPQLFIEPAVLYTYDTYNALDYVRATDERDGNISDKINVLSSNVNMKQPGTYTTCYEVYNSYMNKAQGCGSVNVLARLTRKRFVSKYTIHNTYLRMWDRGQLKSRMKKEESLQSIRLGFD